MIRNIASSGPFRVMTHSMGFAISLICHQFRLIIYIAVNIGFIPGVVFSFGAQTHVSSKH